MREVKVNSRKGNQLDPKVFAALFLGVALIFVLVGTILLGYPKLKAKKCTESVKAEVIELSPDLVRFNGSGSRGRRNSTVYRPTFSFVFEGKEYHVVSNTASNPPAFHEGEIVELRIDPNDPENFYAPGDKTTKFIAVVFLVISGIFIVIGIAILTVKKKTVQNDEMSEVEDE